MSQSLVGQTLRSRYDIFKLLGAGGFGDTYLAYDCDLPGKPKRVVKHLAPKNLDSKDFHLAERLFKQEAELLYKLGEQHDQIPFLYAYFQEGGQFYLVQEFIEGHDLTQEIPPGQKLGEDDTLELLEEVLSVLSFVHENGVIHRDIKPQNIMRRERDGKLFLIDFGAVKEINVMTTDGTGQTSLTVGIGSPGFMPNEQANGRPKLSSDVYAVGMIGVTCLTGVQPSQLSEDKQTGELIWQHLAQVSEQTSQFLQTMVRDHFSQRFETATVAHSALSKLLIEIEEPRPTDVSPDSTTEGHTRRSRGLIAVLGLVGIGLFGSILSGLYQNLNGPSKNVPSSQDDLPESTEVSSPGLSDDEFQTVEPGNIDEPKVQAPNLDENEFQTVEPGTLIKLPSPTTKQDLPSDRKFYVVTNYKDSQNLKLIQRMYPEAKVVEFTAGTRIQIKEFNNEDEARKFASEVVQKGILVEILASTLNN